jgi:peroxiredoxin
VVILRALILAGLLLTSACVGSQLPVAHLPQTDLISTERRAVSLPAVDRAKLTVLVFFSAGCDCQAAHDARLRELYHRYRPLGVELFAVDSEVEAEPARDAAEAGRRAYPYPMLIDRGGRLAQQLGAEYATYTVVLDAHGNVRYRGALDSDQVELHADATFYLRDALDALLAGRTPSELRDQGLGCALRLW